MQFTGNLFYFTWIDFYFIKSTLDLFAYKFKAEIWVVIHKPQGL